MPRWPRSFSTGIPTRSASKCSATTCYSSKSWGCSCWARSSVPLCWPRRRRPPTRTHVRREALGAKAMDLKSRSAHLTPHPSRLTVVWRSYGASECIRGGQRGAVYDRRDRRAQPPELYHPPDGGLDHAENSPTQTGGGFPLPWFPGPSDRGAVCDRRRRRRGGGGGWPHPSGGPPEKLH